MALRPKGPCGNQNAEGQTPAFDEQEPGFDEGRFRGGTPFALSSGAKVTETGLYIGSALQGVDGKGRVAIPADFRAAIEINSATRTVMVAFHDSLPCLRAFDTQWARDAEADFRRRLAEGASPVEIAAERELVFGEVEQAAFDPSGRFILPDFFRKEVEIGARAFFIGAGNTFNIWAPEKLVDHASVPDRVRRRCAHLMAGKVKE